MIRDNHFLERPTTSTAPTTSKIRPINHQTQLPLIGIVEEGAKVAMGATVGDDSGATGVLIGEIVVLVWVGGIVVLVWVGGMPVELGVGETGDGVDVE